MAIFNITNTGTVGTTPDLDYFRASNATITIDTIDLKISQITL